MRKFFLLLIVCVVANHVLAQFPFKGGSGDGYAMADLNVSTNSTSPQIDNLIIYPNPIRQSAQSQIVVSGTFIAARLELLDTKGRKVYEDHVFRSGQRMEMHSFLPGIYFLHIQQGAKQSTRKLVIQP